MLLLTAAPAIASTPERVVLQLNNGHPVRHAGYYAAQALGYYAAQGLEVEIARAGDLPRQEGQEGNPAIAMVAGGAAQFGIGETEVLLARDQGVPLVVLAAVLQHSPTEIYGLDEDPHNPDHLRIGVRAGDDLHIEILTMFLLEGVAPGRIETAEYASLAEAAEMLRDGRIDVFQGERILVPFLMQRLGLPQVYGIAPPVYGVDFYSDMVFSSQAFARDNPGLVERFLEATRQGWKYALAHPGEMAELLPEPTRPAGAPPARVPAAELVRHSLETLRGFVDYPVISIGHINHDRLERIYQTLAHVGLAKGEVPVAELTFDPDAWREQSQQRLMRALGSVTAVLLGIVLGALLIILFLRRAVQARTRALSESNRLLRESEQTFRSIFENAPLGIFLATPEGRFRDVNPSLAEMTGHASPRELLERVSDPCSEFFAQPGACRRLLDQLQVGNRAASVGSSVLVGGRLLFRKKNGEVFTGNLLLKAVRSADGAVLHYQGLVEDISEMLAAEEHRLRLDTAMQQSSVGVYICDPSGAPIYANPAFRRMAWPEESHGSASPPALDPALAPALDPALAEPVAEALATGRPRKLQVRLRSETAPLLLDVVLRPIRDPDGPAAGAPGGASGDQVDSLLVLATDITTEEALKRELLQAQKMQAVGTFAGGIAHDFNNMLVPILMHSELATLTLAQDDPFRPRAAEILAAARKARDLVRQILVFVRGGEERPVVLDLRGQVRETVNLVASTLPANVRLKLDIQAEGPAVRLLAAPAQVHQLVANLCSNAVQAMAGEGGELRVALRVVAPDELPASDELSDDMNVAGEPAPAAPHGWAVLEVADTGSGIAPEHLDRIFDPFFTTKSMGDGTGLGLAIVHRTVQQLGGSIAVRSVLREGERTGSTVVEVHLPLAQPVHTAQAAQPVQAAAPTRPAQAATPHDSLAGRSVLLVDDDPANTESLRQVLEQLGCRVTALTDPEVAWRRFAKAPGDFDLLLADLAMPRLGGLDLAGHLHRIRPGIPVVLLSGDDEELTPAVLAAAGVRATLAKPFGIDELRHSLDQALAPDAASQTSGIRP